jgi:hypothetical protein
VLWLSSCIVSDVRKHVCWTEQRKLQKNKCTQNDVSTLLWQMVSSQATDASSWVTYSTFSGFCTVRLMNLAKSLCFLTEHHAMKAYWGSGGTSRILDLGTRCRWMISFTIRPLYSQGKSPCYPLHRRLGGPQNRSGRSGKFVPVLWAPRHEGVLGEWRYSSIHSLTSALDGGEWSASRPGSLNPGKVHPVPIG